jgi:ribosomal protein S10
MSIIIALFQLTLLPYATFFGIAVYLFIAPCYDKMSAQTFIEFFQTVDPYMKVWAKRLLLMQIALTILLLVLMHNQWTSLSSWLTLLGLMISVTSMEIAIKGNVPLNRQMDRWSPLNPPLDWERVRDRWLYYHHLRGVVVASFIARILSTTASIGVPRELYIWRTPITPIS